MVNVLICLFLFHISPANYMSNWKCTSILKGDGSPVYGSSGQPGSLSAVLGSASAQSALNGATGR